MANLKLCLSTESWNILTQILLALVDSTFRHPITLKPAAVCQNMGLISGASIAFAGKGTQPWRSKSFLNIDKKYLWRNSKKLYIWLPLHNLVSRGGPHVSQHRQGLEGHYLQHCQRGTWVAFKALTNWWAMKVSILIEFDGHFNKGWSVMTDFGRVCVKDRFW